MGEEKEAKKKEGKRADYLYLVTDPLASNYVLECER